MCLEGFTHCGNCVSQRREERKGRNINPTLRSSSLCETCFYTLCFARAILFLALPINIFLSTIITGRLRKVYSSKIHFL